jgi:hypothetical protein
MTKFHYNTNIPSNVYYNNASVNKVFYVDANGIETEVWPLASQTTIPENSGDIRIEILSGVSANLTVEFRPDGSISTTSGAFTFPSSWNAWAVPVGSGAGNNYSIRVTTPASGVSGVLNQWISMSTWPTAYTIAMSIPTSSALANLTVEVRDNTTQSIVSNVYRMRIENEDL